MVLDWVTSLGVLILVEPQHRGRAAWGCDVNHIGDLKPTRVRVRYLTIIPTGWCQNVVIATYMLYTYDSHRLAPERGYGYTHAACI